jgi:hypothetical protein
MISVLGYVSSNEEANIKLVEVEGGCWESFIFMTDKTRVQEGTKLIWSGK